MDFSRAKKLDEHAKAAVNLYGVISLAEWGEFFHRHYGERLTDNDLAFLQGRSGPSYYLRGGDLVQFSFRYEDFAAVEPLKKRVRDKLRYRPCLKEFLRHATLGYYEWTPQIEALDAYVRGKMNLEGDSAKGLVEQIVLICISGGATKDVIGHISFFTDTAYLDDLFDLVSDVHHHSRSWENKGHTPAEMAATDIP